MDKERRALPPVLQFEKKRWDGRIKESEVPNALSYKADAAKSRCIA